MKKTINLTESQLRRLIEYEIKNVAHGIDPRTLLNAASRRRKQDAEQYGKDIQDYRDNMGAVALIDLPDTYPSDAMRKNRQMYLDRALAAKQRAKENQEKRQKRIHDLESYAMEKYGYLHPESTYATDAEGGIYAVTKRTPMVLDLRYRKRGGGDGWLDDQRRPTSEIPTGSEDLNDFLDQKSYYDSTYGWGKPEDKARRFWKKNESIARRVTESVMRRLREDADPFEHINRVWDGIFQSWKNGLFDGMGFDKYLQWKMNGRTNLPPITRNEAYDMLDAVSDKLEDLWSDGQGDSDLANQLAHIEGDLTDIVQLI